MPQNPNQVTAALNPSNATASLRVDANGALITTTDSPTAGISVVQTLGTIASTGTFQVAMAANADRALGGSISNHGAALQLVAFGTTAASRGVQVAAGGTLHLIVVFPTEPYTGAISITGTATQTFTTTEVTKD